MEIVTTRSPSPRASGASPGQRCRPRLDSLRRRLSILHCYSQTLRSNISPAWFSFSAVADPMGPRATRSHGGSTARGNARAHTHRRRSRRRGRGHFPRPTNLVGVAVLRARTYSRSTSHRQTNISLDRDASRLQPRCLQTSLPKKMAGVDRTCRVANPCAAIPKPSRALDFHVAHGWRDFSRLQMAHLLACLATGCQSSP